MSVSHGFTWKMIKASEIAAVGSLLKPHGIKGEIVADLDQDIKPDKLRCIVLDIDGIFVPFFISGIRNGGSSSTLLTIDGITNENEAKELCGKEIYALKSDVPDVPSDDEGGFYLADLIGFNVESESGKVIGKIEDYDDSTSNVLLIVSPQDKRAPDSVQLYIPLADEYITEIDAENRTIKMSLPSGLLDLNHINQ